MKIDYYLILILSTICTRGGSFHLKSFSVTSTQIRLCVITVSATDWEGQHGRVVLGPQCKGATKLC